MTFDTKQLIQDIEERARVAWLKFERDLPTPPDPVSAQIREAMGCGFMGGYKLALTSAIRIRLGIDE